VKIDPVQYYTKYDFLPNVEGGIYGMGFGQLLNPINAGVNTTLNMLIDAGHRRSSGGGFIGRGLNMHGGSVRFKLGEYKPINATAPPSATPSCICRRRSRPGAVPAARHADRSRQGDRGGQGRALSGDVTSQTMQPTTLLALIEQGLKVFTAIYKRVYPRREARTGKLYRLNRALSLRTGRLPDRRPVEEDHARGLRAGRRRRADLRSDMVSDMQMLGRAGFLSAFKDDPLCDPIEIRRRMMAAAKIEGADKIIRKEVPQPPPDPAIELAKMQLVNEGVKVASRRRARIASTRSSRRRRRSTNSRRPTRHRRHADRMDHDAARGRQARNGSIWHETGWFKGADGEWRFEIPGDDRAGVFGLSPERQANSTQQIGEFSKEIIGKENRGLRYPDAIQHPELFDAYPWLVDRSTAVHPLEGGARGSLDRSSGIMRLDEKLDPWEARSVGLHELQHAIQGEEGFARGGSPSSFTQQADAKLARDAMSLRREFDALPSGMDRSAKENAIRENYKSLGIEDWLPSKESWDIAHDRIGNPDEALNRVIKLYNLDKSVTVASPHDVYRRVAGEVEARNVQARKDMTDYERKITPPWKTEDIPAADQVVIRNGDMQFGSMAPMDERAGSGYSLIPVDHDPFAPVQ
jgi:hypothetical protein